MAETGPIDRARAALSDRAELPGMSLMEHLEELRKRILRSLGFLAAGFALAYGFRNTLVAIIQKPLLDVGLRMTMTHPTDALNLSLKPPPLPAPSWPAPSSSTRSGCLSRLECTPTREIRHPLHERHGRPLPCRYVVRLSLSSAWRHQILVMDFGKNFSHMITIDDYTGFFLAVILGLGICFELPILIFFLALFGIVDAKFLLRHFRYAVLAIFLVAAIICPMPDPFSMCLFASPMLALDFLRRWGCLVRPPQRRKRKEKSAA